MYRGLRVIAIAPVLNEEAKIPLVVERMPRDVVDEVMVVDDGSSDRSASLAESAGANVMRIGETVGVGAALRLAYFDARERGFDLLVTVAGNNKDAPEEIPSLLDPICDGRADFVQGSRFLKPDQTYGAMPLYRRLATRVHPLLFSLVARKRVSESTNGFRAFRRELIEDSRLNLDQRWLDEYELEPYLYIQAIRLGYRTAEVPVTKTYPPKSVGQTKMTPFVGWWSILRPLVYLGLGIRK